METIEVVKKGFRELLEAMPYDKITVMSICRSASISKKTFYKYFASKPEIVQAIYYDDFIVPILELNRLLPLQNVKSAPTLITERDFKTLFENRKIYLNLLENYGRMQFIDLIIQNTESSCLKTMSSSGLSELDLEFSAYFIAATSAMIKIRWMEGGFKESPETMTKLLNTWVVYRQDY